MEEFSFEQLCADRIILMSHINRIDENIRIALNKDDWDAIPLFLKEKKKFTHDLSQVNYSLDQMADNDCEGI